MRASLLALVVIAAACHPPTLQDRARQAGHKVSAAAHKVASLVVRVDHSVDPATKAQLRVAVASAAANAAANGPQLRFEKHVSATTTTTDAPAPVASSPSSVPVSVQRIDHTQAPSFVAHYKNAAGQWTCSAYKTMNECTTNCTAIARQTGQCNCVEGESCL